MSTRRETMKLKVTELILLFFLTNSVRSCPSTDIKNSNSLYPWKANFAEGETTEVTCSVNYMIGWATDTTMTTGVLVCEGGVWKQQGDSDYSGVAGCVVCISGTVDCTDGTCNEQGLCDCIENYKRNPDNQRVCIEKTCPLALSNAAADIAEPYTDGTVVTVTCTEGYHVKGAETEETEQVLTCNDEAFTPLVKDCEVCSTDDDCTDGTCTNNGLCECDENEGYKLVEGSPNVCELVKCDDNYCQNNGVCSVRGLLLECDCPTGTTGDQCQDFSSDPCSTNPCENSGTCTRDLSNVDDVTNFLCQCTDEFEGGVCQFAKVFHFGTSSTGVRISDETGVESAEFTVNMAAGISHMYIVLIKGIDMSDNDIKVVLKKIDDETLELSVSKQIQLLPTSTDQAVVPTLASGTSSKLRIHKDSSSLKIKLDVNDVTVITSAQTVKLFTEFWFGGSPEGCGWDQQDCTAGVSRTFYTSFVGSFLGVKLGDQRKVFSDMGDNKVLGSMGCTEYNCVNSGSCSDTTGNIVCSCPQGFSGLHCDRYSGISFNGYTSTLQSNLRTVPIDSDLQTLNVDISKSESEVGEIVRLNLGTQSCDISISAAGGNQYTLEDKTVTIDGVSLEITFDGTNANIGDVGVSCPWDFSSSTSTILYKLGGTSPTNGRRRRSTTLQNKSFQGCVTKLSLNGLDLLQQGEMSQLENVVTDDCVSDLLPANPCEGHNCQQGWSCSVDPDDYSAMCTYTCSAGLHTCTSNGQCTSLQSNAECVSQYGVEKCSVRWYYQCVCNEGWEGDNCQIQSSQDEETESSSEVMNNTTIIILIIALLIVIVLGIVIIVLVKKQKISPINFIVDGKDRGWFNPQALAEDDEDGDRGRDPTFQLAISNLSAGQRAIKLDYTPPNT